VIRILKKLQLTHYRPGQALRVQEVEAPTISGKLAIEGGKVISPTLPPPLLIPVRG